MALALVRTSAPSARRVKPGSVKFGQEDDDDDDESDVMEAE